MGESDSSKSICLILYEAPMCPVAGAGGDVRAAPSMRAWRMRLKSQGVANGGKQGQRQQGGMAWVSCGGGEASQQEGHLAFEI